MKGERGAVEKAARRVHITKGSRHMRRENKQMQDGVVTTTPSTPLLLAGFACLLYGCLRNEPRRPCESESRDPMRRTETASPLRLDGDSGSMYMKSCELPDMADDVEAASGSTASRCAVVFMRISPAASSTSSLESWLELSSYVDSSSCGGDRFRCRCGAG